MRKGLLLLGLGIATWLSLASAGGGQYVTSSNDGCVALCEYKYNKCVDEGAAEWACGATYKRCLRRCN